MHGGSDDVCRVIVYSATTGGYDDPRKILPRSRALPEDNVDYVSFYDAAIGIDPITGNSIFLHQIPVQHRKSWRVEPMRWTHESEPARTARYHKCFPNLVLPDHDYSVWLDGNLVLNKINVWRDIVRPLVQSENNIRVFKHPDRLCAYDEAAVCSRTRRDYPDLLVEQAKRYVADGYPSQNGLIESGCLVRANVESVNRLNERWWQEIEQGSRRDQVSFNYVCWKLGMEYDIMPGSIRKNRNKFVHRHLHTHRYKRKLWRR
jgi:hypothetical protein